MIDKYKKSLCRELFWHDRKAGFSLDLSRMGFGSQELKKIEPKLRDALSQMESLESGEIANPDEGRMVGHYWLRDAAKAPTEALSKQVTENVQAVQTFASSIHNGSIAPTSGGRFKTALIIGIGGSALGPQFVFDALRSATDPLTCAFIDNTDADGMSRVLQEIDDLGETLCIVISKSGGTRETQNGCAVAKHLFEKRDLCFEKHAVAITGEGSKLYQRAKAESWLEIFPMWDWVGGRTSVLSAVGLLPAALHGLKIDALLDGARAMDVLTRAADPSQNPACLLAAAWHLAGDGKGKRDMVVLPYKDRLLLFSRYLQQLVMESLGKEKDLQGENVYQGLSVFGNKGSTDQHAYVQQLRDGLDNFFAVFIEVFQDHLNRSGQEHSEELSSLEVEPGVTCGDYLIGFCQGTKEALTQNDRISLTISIDRLDEQSVGGLIALFERAVGFYASMIGINAYHQPGVEAGKRAAGDVLSLQEKILQFLSTCENGASLKEVCNELTMQTHEDRVMVILRHLVANGRIDRNPADSIFDDTYSLPS